MREKSNIATVLPQLIHLLLGLSGEEFGVLHLFPLMHLSSERVHEINALQSLLDSVGLLGLCVGHLLLIIHFLESNYVNYK